MQKYNVETKTNFGCGHIFHLDIAVRKVLDHNTPHLRKANLHIINLGVTLPKQHKPTAKEYCCAKDSDSCWHYNAVDDPSQLK